MASTKKWSPLLILLLLLCSVCLEFAAAAPGDKKSKAAPPAADKEKKAAPPADDKGKKPEIPGPKVPKDLRCRNKDFPDCYWIPFTCPTDCPRNCKVDCEICRPVCHCNKPGAICNDPQFVGGDGITFYFHGKKGKEFCLVTDTNLHINGHFIGRRGDGMKRDFTWVQSIGVLFGNHKLFLGAKKVAQWDDAVDQLAIAFDGEPVSLPTTENAKWTAADSSLTITRSGSTTNEIVMEAPNNFKIAAKVVPITKQDSKVHRYGITDDDCFAHLDLGFRFYSLTGSVNGVLGQTYADSYQSRANIGLKMPVLGGDREFKSSGLFATDCAVARFRGVEPSIVEGAVDHDEDLKCKTGFNGRGMICKK